MTKERQREVILALGIFLFLGLSSCALSKKEQIQKQTDDGAKRAQLELDAGEFQRAINIYKDIYQRYPKDPVVQAEYVKTLEAIKSKGDIAFQKNNTALAVNIYDILAANWPSFSDFSPSLSFDLNSLEKKARPGRSLLAEKQARAYIETGEFKKAIDTHKDFTQKYPKDPAIQNDYVKTLEAIKGKGDIAFQKKNFALAGTIYGILLKSFPSSAHLSHSLSFDKKILNGNIERCRKTLFEKGLKQYRSGDMDQAISTWKSILVFDPENQEVKKAVDTAVLQLKNLEKTK